MRRSGRRVAGSFRVLLKRQHFPAAHMLRLYDLVNRYGASRLQSYESVREA